VSILGELQRILKTGILYFYINRYIVGTLNNIIQESPLYAVITRCKTTVSARDYTTTNGRKTWSWRSVCVCVNECNKCVCVCAVYVINAAAAVPCWRARAKSISSLASKEHSWTYSHGVCSACKCVYCKLCIIICVYTR